MPLTYPAGVMKEHLHTREHAGLFDISHMKLILVSGPQAATLLARACPVDPEALDLRQSKYSFLLNGAAGIIDDLIITRLGPERFMVVANAGNAARDEARAARACVRARLRDRTARPRVSRDPGAARPRPFWRGPGSTPTALVFMQGFEPRKDWFMSRSGYTGEDGFEIGLPAAGCARAGRER